MVDVTDDCQYLFRNFGLSFCGWVLIIKKYKLIVSYSGYQPSSISSIKQFSIELLRSYCKTI